MSTPITGRGAVFAVVGVLLLAAVATAPRSDASTLYACVKKSGAARILTKKPRCKRDETKLSWNTTGPPGQNGAACLRMILHLGASAESQNQVAASLNQPAQILADELNRRPRLRLSLRGIPAAIVQREIHGERGQGRDGQREDQQKPQSQSARHDRQRATNSV